MQLDLFASLNWGNTILAATSYLFDLHRNTAIVVYYFTGLRNGWIMFGAYGMGVALWWTVLRPKRKQRVRTRRPRELPKARTIGLCVRRDATTQHQHQLKLRGSRHLQYHTRPSPLVIYGRSTTVSCSDVRCGEAGRLCSG